MQREILFRGKAIGTDEWVYGCLLSDYAGTCQIWTKDSDNSSHNYLVIPETVGQFTGLTDKNGDKIYEGDIYRLGSGISSEILYKNGGFGYRMHPEWKEDFIGFAGHNNLSKVLERIEVISNIHENPELLNTK